MKEGTEGGRTAEPKDGDKKSERKGREGKGREGKGREGRGKEAREREGKEKEREVKCEGKYIKNGKGQGEAGKGKVRRRKRKKRRGGGECLTLGGNPSGSFMVQTVAVSSPIPAFRGLWGKYGRKLQMGKE